jgi:hypothetical protein
MSDEMRCGNCFYGSSYDDIDECHGICRRYPPIYIKDDEYDATEAFSWFQPAVSTEHDWCGEWKTKNKMACGNEEI